MPDQNLARYIGRAGEKYLSLLLSEAGLTCNPSTEDDGGWDLFVEWPGSTKVGPIDTRPGPRSALIQVKSTISQRMSWNVSLANALRLAKSPLPAFLVMLSKSKDGRRAIYAIHVGNEYIRRILEVGRRADAEQKLPHKSHLAVKFSQRDCHTEDFVEWVEGVIGVDVSEYSKNKKSYADTVGFEDRLYRMEFSFDGSNPDDFIDWQLGIKDGLDVTNISIASTRFGIFASEPDSFEASGKIFIESKGVEGVLTLEFPGGMTAQCGARLIQPVLPGLPGGSSRMRLIAGPLEIVLTKKGVQQIRLTPSTADRQTLESLEVFSLIRAAPDNELELKFEGKGQGEAIKTSLGRFKINGANGGSYWQSLYGVVKSLRELYKSDDREIFHSLDDFRPLRRELILFSALVAGGSMMLDIEPEGQVPKKFSRFVSYAIYEIADSHLCVLIERPVTKDQKKKGRRQIHFGKPDILWFDVGSNNDEMIGIALSKYDERLEKIGGSGTVIGAGNFLEFVNNCDGNRILTMDVR